MKRKKKSSLNEYSESLSQKHTDENADKKNLNPDNLYEETGPPIKEMPIADNPHHPHHEEILDSTPK